MKRIITILSIIALLSVNAFAQSSDVKKVAKSVFTLTTFKANGDILTTSHGVFIGQSGEAISLFNPFVGAASAAVVDASGKMYDVEAIIGANDMYDVCHFRVAAKTTPAVCATTPASGNAWMVGYSTKKPAITSLPINSVETFMEKYSYYIFGEELNEQSEGCPIVNSNGQVIGLATRPSSSYIIHATDAQFFMAQMSEGLSSRNPVLQKTGIRIALPTDREQARLMLMMIDANADSIASERCIDEYLATYPEDVDGYSTRSRIALAYGHTDVVDKVMSDAIKKVANKDEAYSEYAKFIYNKCVYMPDSLDLNWTLDKAFEMASKADEIKPLYTYKHQMAQIVYAKGDYAKAIDYFSETAQEMPSSEVYFEMAQSKNMLNAEKSEVLTYLDKAVEACPKPLTQVSAPYIVARGTIYDEMGEYKKAVMDYNLYDTLMVFRASDDFYYKRYLCETKLHMNQQALNDIAHAAYINPTQPTYLAELAALQLRLGRYEDALQACDLCLRLTDEYADVYVVKGVALAQLKRTAEAKEALLRAKELGDERADGFIDKYCK